MFCFLPENPVFPANGAIGVADRMQFWILQPANNTRFDAMKAMLEP